MRTMYNYTLVLYNLHQISTKFKTVSATSGKNIDNTQHYYLINNNS